MTEETAKLLAAVQDGTVPEGYTKVWHLMPEDWKDVPLSHIFKKKRQKNKGNNVKTVFTNSAVNGIIPQSEYFEKDIANTENTEGYFVVDPLDYVYNPRISENAPYGPFKRNDTGLTGIVSPLYTVLTPRKEFAKSEFLHYYLESEQWHKYAYSIANCGARFDRMNITDDELMRLPIAWPSLAEQERIAEILMQCDKVIKLHQDKADELKKLKKACLKGLFPEKGAAIPKIRFPGYEDTWEQKKLGDISSFITKGATPTTYGFSWQTDGIPFFRNDCIRNNTFVYGDFSYISESANEALRRSEIQGNDILIAITGDIGKVSIVPKTIKKANINQHIARIRVESGEPYFVYQYLASDAIQKDYKKIKTGISMPQLSLEQIRGTVISMPTAKEQRAIGMFFESLDNLIFLNQQEIDEWNDKKKFLTQALLTGVVRVK